MSSAPDAEQQESSAPLDPATEPAAAQPQTSGGGDLTPPPGSSEQAEAEIMGPSTSTVFVAGGSGFVGSEICSQVKSRPDEWVEETARVSSIGIAGLVCVEGGVQP